MRGNRLRPRRVLAVFLSVTGLFCFTLPAQQTAQPGAKAQPAPSGQPAAVAGREYSGMYSFRKEGEFVQVTVEEGAHVTGFVSRYGDGDSDSGEFLDQFFKTAKLDGNKLAFTTQTVHGTWFGFEGTVERGSGKSPDDENYYALKGTLTENTIDVNKYASSKSNQVTLKRFPSNLDPAQPKQD
jgi:hypothetical protein